MPFLDNDSVFSDAVRSQVNAIYDKLTEDYNNFSLSYSDQKMHRKENSFHDEIKLLGYLSLLLKEIDGAIIEIGVWKGKSLTLMKRLSRDDQLLVGVDPLELYGQRDDFSVFRERFFPRAVILDTYSECAFRDLVKLAKKCKLIHVDGGDKRENVVLDFILYSRLLQSGGYMVFDDYGDDKHSPEVAPAINMLAENGYFSSFDVLGTVLDFKNSFVIRKNYNE